jgi:LmbE family N-acetylglucosaminyl deacetylase
LEVLMNGDLQMERMAYISPHLDDAVLSCGGVIYQQTSRGDEIVVVTVCGGVPHGDMSSEFIRELQKRWGTGESAVEHRRAEDRRACAMLGARTLHLPIPDAIYRTSEDGKYFYDSEGAIFGEIHPEEIRLIDQVARMIAKECEGASRIYAPMGYGGHVDHRLTRKAVDRLGRSVWFYRDYPYVIREGKIPSDLSVPTGEEILARLSDDEIVLWAEAVKEYRSQISTFWSDPQMVEGELREAYDRYGGVPFIYQESSENGNGFQSIHG